jgi:hypothetical protein
MHLKKPPARPRLERYRKLAKDLLAAHRSEDPGARFTLSDAHSREEAPADRRDRYREAVEVLAAAVAAPPTLQTGQT